MTQLMTLTGATNSISIPIAQYGYKSIIELGVKFNKKSNGTIGVFDFGKTYDRYICEFEVSLTKTQAQSILTFLFDTDRAETYTLSPSGDFSPFSPFRGVESFDIKILSFKESNISIGKNYKHYKYKFKIQNVGVFPSHTLPPIIDEGKFNIGSSNGLDALRYPENGISNLNSYKIGALSQYGKNVELTNWSDTVVGNCEADFRRAQFQLMLRRGSMARLVYEIIENIRFDSTLFNSGALFNIFGSVSSSNNSNLLNSKLEIVHVMHEKYTINLDVMEQKICG